MARRVAAARLAKLPRFRLRLLSGEWGEGVKKRLGLPLTLALPLALTLALTLTLGGQEAAAPGAV